MRRTVRVTLAALLLVVMAGLELPPAAAQVSPPRSVTSYFAIGADGSIRPLAAAPAQQCNFFLKNTQRTDSYGAHHVKFSVATYQDVCNRGAVWGAATADNYDGGVLVAIPSVRLYLNGVWVASCDNVQCTPYSNLHRWDAKTSEYCGTGNFKAGAYYRANPDFTYWRDENWGYTPERYIGACP